MLKFIFELFSKKSESSVFSLFYFLLGIFLILFDQGTKQYAARHYTDMFQTSVFDLDTYRNFDFAFSLPIPFFRMMLLYVVLLVSMFVYIASHGRQFSSLERVGWVCIVAGALSNVAERVVKGFVLDFIKIGTGYFNIADFYIIFGVFVLIFLSIFPFARSRP